MSRLAQLKTRRRRSQLIDMIVIIGVTKVWRRLMTSRERPSVLLSISLISSHLLTQQVSPSLCFPSRIIGSEERRGGGGEGTRSEATGEQQKERERERPQLKESGKVRTVGRCGSGTTRSVASPADGRATIRSRANEWEREEQTE